MPNTDVSPNISDLLVSKVFECLQHPQRRLALGVLYTRGSLTLSDLATRLVAVTEDIPLIDVDTDDQKETLVNLQHLHLPDLQRANLVTSEESSGTISLVNREFFTNLGLDMILQSREIALRDDWDEIFETLSDDEARCVLGILHSESGAMSLCKLAAQMAAYEQDIPVDDIADETVYEMAEHLHHLVFPALLTANLVEYDSDDHLVKIIENPNIQSQWLAHNLGGQIHNLLSNPTSDGLWTVNGRDNIKAQGRQMVVDSTDEAFIIVSSPVLINEACIQAVEEAVDRGVDVYIGSQSQEARNLILDRVPGVVVWEPNLDYHNLPPYQESVGRLMFCDREDVMLSTFEGESEAAGAKEIAVIGDGPNNPLAKLLRDTLDTRFRRLPEESEAALAQIPL